MILLAIIGLIIAILLLIASVELNDKKFVYWAVVSICLNLMALTLHLFGA